jgi:hypothetical protein
VRARSAAVWVVPAALSTAHVSPAASVFRRRSAQPTCSFAAGELVVWLVSLIVVVAVIGLLFAI